MSRHLVSQSVSPGFFCKDTMSTYFITNIFWLHWISAHLHLEFWRFIECCNEQFVSTNLLNLCRTQCVHVHISRKFWFHICAVHIGPFEFRLICPFIKLFCVFFKYVPCRSLCEVCQVMEERWVNEHARFFFHYICDKLKDFKTYNCQVTPHKLIVY